jgi:hypothetical protein
MAHTRESRSDAVRLDFDRRSMLQFRDSLVTSDAALPANSELDDVLDSLTFTSNQRNERVRIQKRLDQAVKHHSVGRECREAPAPSHLGFQPLQKTLTVHVRV